LVTNELVVGTARPGVRLPPPGRRRTENGKRTTDNGQPVPSVTNNQQPIPSVTNHQFPPPSLRPRRWIERKNVSGRRAELIFIQIDSAHRQHGSGVLTGIGDAVTDDREYLLKAIAVGRDPEPFAVGEARRELRALGVLPVTGKADALAMEDLSSLLHHLLCDSGRKGSRGELGRLLGSSGRWLRGRWLLLRRDGGGIGVGPVSLTGRKECRQQNGPGYGERRT
jgi:hypothetical protein